MTSIGPSLADTMARPSAATARSEWANMATLRRGNRSATCPAGSMSRSTGASSNTPTRPSDQALPVRS